MNHTGRKRLQPPHTHTPSSPSPENRAATWSLLALPSWALLVVVVVVVVEQVEKRKERDDLRVHSGGEERQAQERVGGEVEGERERGRRREWWLLRAR